MNYIMVIYLSHPQLPVVSNKVSRPGISVIGTEMVIIYLWLLHNEYDIYSEESTYEL